MSKFIHAVQVERVEYDEATIDEYGQPSPGAPVLTDVAGLVQPRSRIDELEDHRSAGSEVGDHVIFLPAGTDVRHADTILFAGDRYDIVGVRDFRYGRLAHLEVDARRVTSTPALVTVGS